MKAQLEREQVAGSTASGRAVRVVLSKDARERMRVLFDTPEFQTTLYRKRAFILSKLILGWFVDDQTLEVLRDVLKKPEIPCVKLGERIKDLQASVAFAKGLTEPNGTSTDLLETESECLHHIANLRLVSAITEHLSRATCTPLSPHHKLRHR